jgi:hypothetical protein
VRKCRNGRSPKETRWWFHDDKVWVTRWRPNLIQRDTYWDAIQQRIASRHELYYYNVVVSFVFLLFVSFIGKQDTYVAFQQV